MPYSFEIGAGTKELVRLALEEDIGSGDITTKALIPSDLQGVARIFAKQKLTVCGNDIARYVLSVVDPAIRYEEVAADGSDISQGSEIAFAYGSYASLLTAERLCLNFFQRLSGVSTKTKSLVQKVAGTNVKILDTRKTTPGFRLLEKYAVRVGGGSNHRIALYDAVLIKNNHIDSSHRSITQAVLDARNYVNIGVKVQVEVRDMNELAQAITGKPDAVLLDNMTPPQIKEAVSFIRSSDCPELEIEASGGITEVNLAEYAAAGVDSVSIGALMHSAAAVDIAMHIRVAE